MKLSFKICIFICLSSLLLCDDIVWIDKSLTDAQFSDFCEKFTGNEKEETNPDLYDKEDNFRRCQQKLKDGWLNIYPVAPCIVEFNGIKSLIITKKIDNINVKYPTIMLDEDALCTRFFPKQIKYIFHDNEKNLQSKIIEANLQTLKINHIKAIDELQTIMKSVGNEELLAYVNENLTFNILRSSVVSDVELKILLLSKDSFFKNYIFASYYCGLKKINIDLCHKYLLQAAAQDKGDIAILELLYNNNFLEDAIAYLQQELHFSDVYFGINVQPKIQKTLVFLIHQWLLEHKNAKKEISSKYNFNQATQEIFFKHDLNLIKLLKELEDAKKEVMNYVESAEQKKQNELEDAKKEVMNYVESAERQKKKELENAKSKLENAKSKLKDAQINIDDVKIKLKDAKSKFGDAQINFDHVEIKLKDREINFDNAMVKLKDEDVEIKFVNAMRKFEDAKINFNHEINNAKINFGQEIKLKDAEINFDKAKIEFKEAKSKYKNAESEFKVAQSKLEAAESEFKVAQSKLEAAESEFKVAQSKLEAANREFEAANKKVREYETIVSKKNIEYEKAKAELDKQTLLQQNNRRKIKRK
jgi:hypothetical protein